MLPPRPSAPSFLVFVGKQKLRPVACPGTPADHHAHSPQVRRHANETTIVYQENEMVSVVHIP